MRRFWRIKRDFVIPCNLRLRIVHFHTHNVPPLHVRLVVVGIVLAKHLERAERCRDLFHMLYYSKFQATLIESRFYNFSFAVTQGA